MFLTGVAQAGIVLLLTAVFNVYIRIGILTYDLKGILFTCITIVSASLVLLFYSGPGRFGLSSFKNVATWGYGFCNIIQYVLDIYLTKYVSATELSLFSRLTIPISIIIALFLFKRKPSKQDLLGVACILLGSVVLFYLQDMQHLKVIIILVILAALFFASEMFFTENHPQSIEANKSGNLMDRARVVGFASYITSLLFLVLSLSISAFKAFYANPSQIQYLSFIPDLKDYCHLPTIISGILYGVFIASIARFFTWSATYKIKTENVLAILVLVPFTTYALEWIISSLFNIHINSFMLEGQRGQLVFLALILMTIGSAISIIPKVFANLNRQPNESLFAAFKRSIEKQNKNLEITYDSIESTDYDVIMHSLNFFDYDYNKVAELFNISTDAVHIIQAGKGNSCFIDEVSKKIHNIYQQNITIKDKLTKANNRIALSVKLQDLITKQKPFNLLLLDLNDFKPVNDQFGHQAGDFTLKETVKRLNTLTPDNVYRLGGDEFVLIADNADADFIKKIKNCVSTKIDYEGNSFKISTSIGIANYPKDGISEKQLLDFADKLLYDEKSSKKR